MNLRICFAAWRDLEHQSAGGAEVYTDRLLSHWVEVGHEVVLLSGSGPGLAPSTVINGYRVMRHGNRFSVYSDTRRALSRSRGLAPDLVVEEINTIPFGLTPPRGARYGALVFQTCEDIWPFIAPQPLAMVGRRVLEPRWMRRLESVPTVTISESSRRDLERMGLRRVAHVPMGRDPQGSSGGSAKFVNPTCIHVGRLVSYKRVRDLIDASAGMPKLFPGFKLLIVGDGPEAPRLQREAPPHVEFMGRVTSQERDRLLSASHLQVVTSVREGWGLIVTEAAEAGTPTLAYDVSGLRDSTAAAGGWLCPPNPDALRTWLPWSLDKAIRGEFTLRADLGCIPWSEVAQRALAHWTQGRTEGRAAPSH